MRFFLITLIGCFFYSTIAWETDFTRAKQLAREEHKFILLSFSGSDWCGPCIRLHKEVFENDAFSQYAKEHLVLLNADFPRLKKNQLSKEQQKKNDQLADVYNKEGVFPRTLLLDSTGNILKTWDGYAGLSPEDFTNQVKTIINDRR